MYIEKIIESGLFKDAIFYSKYNDSKAYVDLTIFSTAKAILNKTQDVYQATVLVDGLRKTERFRFAAGLKKLKVEVHKVRGINEKNDSLIRLADAIAGFVRNCMEGDPDMNKLYKKSEEKKTIQEI